MAVVSKSKYLSSWISCRFSSIATLPRIAAGYDLEPTERTARFAGT
jgi:hypothetical protein